MLCGRAREQGSGSPPEGSNSEFEPLRVTLTSQQSRGGRPVNLLPHGLGEARHRPLTSSKRGTPYKAPQAAMTYGIGTRRRAVRPSVAAIFEISCNRFLQQPFLWFRLSGRIGRTLRSIMVRRGTGLLLPLLGLARPGGAWVVFDGKRLEQGVPRGQRAKNNSDVLTAGERGTVSPTAQ